MSAVDAAAQRARRRIFIGDVQGCREPLERLLERVRFDPSADRLYFAGDLVNKGPDNASVLRLVRDLGAESVLGNHDVRLLELHACRDRDPGKHTLADVLGAPDRDELIAWLHARPLLLALDDVVVVHAALRPGWRDWRSLASELRARFERQWDAGKSPFEDDAVRFALTARYCDAAGNQPPQDDPPPGAPYRNWIEYHAQRGAGAPTIVFGHFARQGLVVRPGVRGLDTGCVYGNTLSAWIAEEDRIEAVPARA